MKVFEAVAHALQEAGTTTVFGLMGDGNLRLLTYWSEELGQAYYGTRHEATAVSMADGYARVTGDVGVCTTTQGPGVGNTLTALVTARKAQTPMLLMVGDVASFQQGWPQDVDHTAIFAAAEVPLVQLDDPRTAYSTVLEALELARTRRGPVGLNMPVDVQDADWEAWEDEPDVAGGANVAPIAPTADEIAAAAQLLLGAQRPVIIAGRGAVESDCAEELAAIGDHVGALLATTLRAKGLFGRHPYSIGIAGGLGSNLGVGLLGGADVALVVGAGLNDFTMMRGTLLSERTRIVRVDISPDRAANRDAALTVVADASTFSRALLAELRTTEPQDGYRPRADESLAGHRPEDEIAPVDEPGVLDARIATLQLDRSLPEDRTVVTDAGHFFGYPVAYMQVPDARAFVCGIDFGSIGLGLGLAMGALVARPDRFTVLFVGDGGLLMSLGDLETVARYRLPLLIVVLNDAAYGSELQILRFWDLPETLSVFPETDFAPVARGLGMAAECITSEKELDEFVASLDLANGPALADVRISQTVRAAWLEEAFRR